MVPTVISHYRLLGPLGEGGMGVVYRAEDLRLGREVAVKVLRADVSPEWLVRFEREARLASSLQHPHICTIHQLGEHDGRPFIAMERLEGRTIRQLVQEGPLPVHRVLHFACQIADALDAAHRRGIIHRDIKPANLFVTYGDHLKVLDFGLAKTTSSDPPTQTAAPRNPVTAAAQAASAATGTAPVAPDLTAAGVAIGTAAYMSPEQALGQPLDARSDLFSLGSVLYEMVTGRRAFGGDDLALIAVRITNGIHVPPRAIMPTIPQDVEAIIQKLMATDPLARYQTAAELLADVRTTLQRIESEGEHTLGSGRSPAAAPVPARTRRFMIAAAAVGVLAVGVAAFMGLRGSSVALTDRDSILIGSFENATGDPVFDETLLTALKVQLEQSPFLDIAPDQRIRETLRLMGREETERLTSPIAREVCERLNLKAMLEGSISTLGRSYVLRLEATDCHTGEPLAREQAEASSQERVLRELGSMSSRMRTKLGESLKSIADFDTPIEQATTPSLSALKAYTLGLEERRSGRELESVAFFNQAIDLDHEFASAYATLSTVYGSLGEWHKSEEYARLAYVLRNRVSERERLFITYQFHDRVTGNQEKAASTLELWKAAYPREMRPVNALALIHHRMGDHARAVEEAQEALRRSPGHPFPLSNLAIAYRALGRYADARATGEEAVKLGVATTPTRRLLYQVGVLMGDGSETAHVEWSKERPREFDLVAAQAQVAAFEGRLREAMELYRRASEMALARALRETASATLAHWAWTEALYRAPHQAADGVRRALQIAQDGGEPATLPRFRGPAALALAGLGSEARPIVVGAQKSYPEATFVETLLVPVTTAAIALHEQKPDQALDALKAAARTELGTVAGLVPPYLRAEAFMQQRMHAEAVAEYARVLDNRGVDPFAPVIPLARLGLARAHAARGDVTASRRAFEELFAVWGNADADFAPLLTARAEYARLLQMPQP